MALQKRILPDRKTALYILILITLASCQQEENNPDISATKGKTYYISAGGSDSGDGSILHPWKNIESINKITLTGGDSVLIEGGKTFDGSVSINAKGSKGNPVVISSFGTGVAVISSGNLPGIVIDFGQDIEIKNIRLIGAGRKDGNTTNGLDIKNCNQVKLDNIEISGYQKSGLSLFNCADIEARNVYAHDNGAAGISVWGGNNSKKDCRNISLLYCKAENNPGDPANTKNHSGNGIIVSQVTNARIAYCTATNNGWDMPRTGNGPVGIWAWDADSVIIENCLSYRNKTSAGGEDGGGFDFDGGVTNSVIQYCLSFENAGSAIGLFEYDQAGPWHHNTIRFNISVNDGYVSSAKAGIYIWNASYSEKLENCLIYNNTIINDKHAAIRYAEQSSNLGFVFYNNIFSGNSEIITSNDTAAKYYGNCWWSKKDGFNVNNIKDFDEWRRRYHQEIYEGVPTGINFDPGFGGIEGIAITGAQQLAAFEHFKASKAILLNAGIDIEQLFKINKGGRGFNGNQPPQKGIGASF